jgi:hypothetical protein
MQLQFAICMREMALSPDAILVQVRIADFSTFWGGNEPDRPYSLEAC